MKKRCRWCQKEFNVPPSRIKIGKGLYCSMQCRKEHSLKNYICRLCGKQYKNYISQKGDKFCSIECYLLSVKKRTITSCLFCGKDINIRTARLKDSRGRYCSKMCSNRAKKKSPEYIHKKRLEYTRQYRKENPDWYTATKHKRRALERNAKGSFTKEEWIEIKKKCGGRCVGCGEEKKLTVDHIIPLSKGGSNSKENIQPLCGRCNSRKYNKILQVKS
jgi:5-methylcytosine-specific restriction endonuclease McrA